jgi:uncharacterized membrane protein
MIRRVVATQSQAVAVGAGQEVDTFLDRVVKYIPAEIVSAWVTAKGVIEGTSVPSKQTVLWICFVVGIALTIGYTLKQTAVGGKSPAIWQTIISTVAFVIWAIALGEPFSSLLGKAEQSLYGSLLLIAYTVIVPIVVTNPDP